MTCKHFVGPIIALYISHEARNKQIIRTGIYCDLYALVKKFVMHSPVSNLTHICTFVSQELLGIIEELQADLVTEVNNKKRAEREIRAQVCEEMMKQFSEIEEEHRYGELLLNSHSLIVCDCYFTLSQELLYTNIDLKQWKKITCTNAKQNRYYVCIQWTSVLYSLVITRQSNPPI